ncbi:MAG: HD domain-containing protein [Treponema sp.]|nr:HD domain-containing protein [Treponema sp.]MCL2271478.1 HD domain-containing protein [Treponema sp.]
MNKETDSRVDLKQKYSLKEYAVMFITCAALSGFNMWIYQELNNKNLFETNVIMSIFILMFNIMFMAFIATIITNKIRYRTWVLPIEKLSKAARNIARGDFSVRITPLRFDGKKDFVEVLFDDFNAMTGELAFINNNLQEIVNEKTAKVVKLQESILRTMANMVEYRDNLTGGHINRTQHTVNLLLEEIKKQELYKDIVDKWDVSLILQSTQLHDVGKIVINDNILKKQGSLTNEEFDEMKKHVIYGLAIIERIETESGESDLLKYAKIFALTHHEKWDGSGYPNNLSGERIPLQGRIMAIADVYDALISERPYKKAMTHEEAVKIIIDGKGAHFEPALIDLFTGIEPIRFFI